MSLVDPVSGRAGRWENAPLATELEQLGSALAPVLERFFG